MRSQVWFPFALVLCLIVGGCRSGGTLLMDVREERTNKAIAGVSVFSGGELVGRTTKYGTVDIRVQKDRGVLVLRKAGYAPCSFHYHVTGAENYPEVQMRRLPSSVP